MRKATKMLKNMQKTNVIGEGFMKGRLCSLRRDWRKSASFFFALCMMIGIIPAQNGVLYAASAGNAISRSTVLEKTSTLGTKSYGVLNPRITKNSTQKSGQVVTYDAIYFGSYPQSEVTGTDLTAAITGAVYDENREAVVDGVKYRRMKYIDATYSYNSNLPGSEGKAIENYYNWRAGGDEQGYHYFKYEPIRWRVLSVTGSDAFLLADTALETQVYHEENTSVTWENCTLRSYLNGYGDSMNKKNIDYRLKNFYYSAFSVDEQQAVYNSTLQNTNNSYYGTGGGNTTEDKIFLLSESDVYKEAYGFQNDYDNKDEARRCRPSEYGFAMGNYIYLSGTGQYEEYNGNVLWRLRTSGKETDSATYVMNSGGIHRIGCYVNNNNLGIRPALHLNLEFHLLYSVGEPISTQYTKGGTELPAAQTPAPTQESTPMPISTQNPKETTVPDPKETATPTSTSTPAPEVTAAPTPLPTQTSLPSVRYKMGDVDGNNKIDLSDANTTLKVALGIVTLSEDLRIAADVDSNNKVNLTDANTVLKAALGIVML